MPSRSSKHPNKAQEQISRPINGCPKRFAHEDKARQARHADVARRYAKHTRHSRLELLAHKRIRELQRLHSWRTGNTLSLLTITIRYAKILNYKATTLGKKLRLSTEERAGCHITTIRDFNATDESMRAERKAKAKERERRRRAQRPPRPPTISATKPWVALGMSRAKWYRLGKPKCNTSPHINNAVCNKTVRQNACAAFYLKCCARNLSHGLSRPLVPPSRGCPTTEVDVMACPP